MSSSMCALFFGLALLLVVLLMVESFPVEEEGPEVAAMRNKRYVPYGYYGGGYQGGYAPYTRQVVYRRTVYPNYGNEYYW